MGALSSVVSETSRGRIPHGRTTLFGITDKASAEEGEMVCPIAGEARRSTKCLRRTWWSDRDRADLL